MKIVFTNRTLLVIFASLLAGLPGLQSSAGAAELWATEVIYGVANDCGSAGANCSGYSNTQASFNERHDRAPRMNNFGDVVWEGRPSNSNEDFEIYFRSADTGITEQITDNLVEDAFARLNDSGEISWMTFDSGLWQVNFFANGLSQTASATGSTLPTYPKISQLGDITWIGNTGSGTDYEIFLYANGIANQLTDNDSDDVQVRINDASDLIWRGRGDLATDSSFDIYTHMDGALQRITNDDRLEWYPELSNSRHLVWSVFDGQQCDIVVQLNGSAPFQISTLSDDHAAVINDRGDVAWEGWDGNDWEIFLYAAASQTITQLTDNDYHDYTPQINNAGDLAWIGLGGEIGVYLYQAATQTISKLSDNYVGHYDTVADLNEQGKVAWTGFDGTDFEIIIAAPSGAIHDDVYFYPHRVNLQSRKKRFKAYIDLPAPYSAADIDPATVAITMISPVDSNSGPLPVPLLGTGESAVGDHDHNGIVDIMIPFDYQQLITLIQPLGVLGKMELSIAGALYDGSPFNGVNAIQVVDRQMSRQREVKPKLRQHHNGKRTASFSELDRQEAKKLARKVLKRLKEKEAEPAAAQKHHQKSQQKNKKHHKPS